MGIEFRTDEVRELAEVFVKVDRRLPGDTRKVVQKGALNIKTDARKLSSGISHAPAYPRSISYDTYDTPTGAWAEIGPDKSRPQGALGNLFEYGSVNNAPIPHMAPAAETERPKFEKALEGLGVKSLGDLG